MFYLPVARWKVPATVAVFCALVCALPARALASATMESSVMDDQQLLYDSPARANKTLKQLAALGVDRVKVSLVWSVVAPDPNSARKPNFNAADPGDYPAGAWSRYDRVATQAHRLGLKVYFMFTPPTPRWAIAKGSSYEGEKLGHAPNLADLEQFVEAAGKRYSGNYDGLPRVSFWGIWNEPNFPSWLNPWERRLPGGATELLQAALYRGIVRSAWDGLAATGHTSATDTILIGETSNSGVQPPEAFIRALYCVGSRLGPLVGSAAADFGCPKSGSRKKFVADNPGLFEMTGFAHHPYSFNLAPNVPYPLTTWITLNNLGSLERMLNGIFASYRQSRPGGVPLYLTEFGYESNPPNPFVENSTAQQATWINQAEYMAWRDPYVRLIEQFELIDSRPDGAHPKGSRAYWSTFQTGLEFIGGKPKPAYPAYRLPIWLPTAHHGSSVAVWGQLRPADHAELQYAVIEFEPRGSSSYEQLSEVATSNTEGFFLVHVAIPSAGYVRLAWLNPDNAHIYYSRAAGVS
jgi:hypothetical protein